MMPYERMGALLAEDADDYVNRMKGKQLLLQQGNAAVGPQAISQNSCTQSTQSAIPYTAGINNAATTSLPQNPQLSFNPSDIQYAEGLNMPATNSSTIYGQSLPNSYAIPPSSATSFPSSADPSAYVPSASAPYTSATSTSYPFSSVPSSSVSSSIPPSVPTASAPPSQVSSIFSSESQNPGTDTDIQVKTKHPNEPAQPRVSHFHPPFLVIDSRREDEYRESHIHGAVNIHYIPPNFLLGHKLEFTLPAWVELDTPIITYCAVGLRSGLMVWELRRRGYKFVHVLSGGYYKWVNEGRPVYAHTGELTETVLQQHRLAGIMLRKELKTQKRNAERKQELDSRVANHHRGDSDWPACRTYSTVGSDQKRKSMAPPGDLRRQSSYGDRRKSNYNRTNSVATGTSQM